MSIKPVTVVFFNRTVETKIDMTGEDANTGQIMKGIASQKKNLQTSNKKLIDFLKNI